MRRGGCLELYYCNMVEWFWWDSSLISSTKIVLKMTYNVLSGLLNTNQLLALQLGLGGVSKTVPSNFELGNKTGS